MSIIQKAASAVVPFIVGIAILFASSIPGHAASKKICKVDHYHTGLGGFQPNIRMAKRDAVKNWESFTQWEYGAAWRKFSRSMHRSFSCSKVAGGGYACTAKAKPCRSAYRQHAGETTAQQIISVFQR